MRLKEIDWNTPETLTETVSVGIEPILFVLDQIYELVNIGPIYEPGRKENEILSFFVDFITNQVKDLKEHLIHLDEMGGVRIPGSIYRTADEVARRRGTSIEQLISDYVNNLMTGRESFIKKQVTEREPA